MNWFRLDSNFWSDAYIYDMNDRQFRIWVTLCAMLSEQNDGEKDTFELSLSQLSVATKCRIDGLKSQLSYILDQTKFQVSYNKDETKLQLSYPNFLKKQRSFKRDGDGKFAPYGSPTLHNSTLHNKTYKKNIKKEKNIKFDFESLYEKYPRKLGKAKGLDKLRKIIKTDDDYNKVKIGIENYATYMKNCNAEDKYIKHFSSFINQSSWEDFQEIPRTDEDRRQEIYDEWVNQENNDDIPC